MSRAPKTKRRKRRGRAPSDPNYFTQAGPVTVRRIDGTTEERPALDPRQYQAVVRVRANTSPAMRAKVAKRDRGTCRYCGTVDGPFEIDHVVPIALGGSNRIGNLVLACRACNAKKNANVWKPRPLRAHP